ncbi:MAG: 50S ribosomal protein L29 [Candidatus Eremiobacteraeota bacterium]|nr:50S ribosomal protein L29 [Candidatus Eremiobacteraeota bacterium]
MKRRDVKKKLREMTPLELEDKLKDATEELFNVRFQLATNHQGDFTKIRQNRRQIARIRTVMRERQLAQ